MTMTMTVVHQDTRPSQIAKSESDLESVCMPHHDAIGALAQLSKLGWRREVGALASARSGKGHALQVPHTLASRPASIMQSHLLCKTMPLHLTQGKAKKQGCHLQ
jgi:hypothetical protein